VAAPTPNPNPACAGLTTAATFVYDNNGLGQLATASSSDNVTTVMHYDPYGRPVGTDETIAGHTYSISQTYNSLGQLSSVNYPGLGTNTTPWITLQNAYTGSGYLSEVDYLENGDTSSKQPIWRVHTRDQNDALVTATFGNTGYRPGVAGKPATLNQL